MNRVLIFSDVHCHPHRRKSERLEDCLKVVDWVFKKAKERNICNILFGGDLLHDRHKIDAYTYMKLFSLFENHLDGNIKMWLLLGNHDMWYAQKHSISSIFPFASLPGVTVVSEVCRKEIAGVNWDFIPYTHDPIASVETLNALPGKKQYCLGHIALHGAVLNSAGTHADVAVEHDGEMIVVDPIIFKGYQQVYLGHYHSAQKMSDTVQYIGSPLQLSFGEAFEKKHIIELDCSTGIEKLHRNTFSPVHLYLRPHELDKHDLKDNFVVILTDDMSQTDIVKVSRELTEAKQVGSIQIREYKDNKDQEAHQIQDAKAILLREEEMLERYVEQAGTDGLDKDRLIGIGKKITEKKLD